MSNYRIPFNRACLQGKEFAYMAQAIADGHISGDGQFTKKCHALLEGELGIPKVLLTTSCTHALEMAALLIGIQPGDEVIFPSFTFVSTVNAFLTQGARPVFSDICPDTLNLDHTQLEHLITARTKAIVAMHYGGIACEMDTILNLAEKYSVAVIEDNAHGLFGKYKGKYLGTFSCLATQSFHETKNFTCGEGGALLINDSQYIERAEIIREKGTNRSRFFRGQVDKYTWVDIGSSYLPSDVLAAFLYAQLEAKERIQTQRRTIWEIYQAGLAEWAVAQGVRLPFIPAHCEQAYHMFYMIMPSLAARTRLIEHLKSKGILSVFHYLPLHLAPMAQQFGCLPGDCPITEEISDRLIRLPFYNELTPNEQTQVIEAIQELPF